MADVYEVRNGKLENVTNIWDLPHIIQFDNEFCMLTREKDPLRTLISWKDGKPIGENLWFYNWNEFDDDFYLAQRQEGGLWTLIRKKDGKLIGENLWFAWWYKFDENFYRVVRRDGFCTLISKEEGTFAFGDKWYKEIIKRSNKIIAQ